MYDIRCFISILVEQLFNENNNKKLKNGILFNLVTLMMSQTIRSMGIEN